MQKTIFQGSDASFQIYVLTHLIAIEISVCVERINIFIFSAAALMWGSWFSAVAHRPRQWRRRPIIDLRWGA